MTVQELDRAVAAEGLLSHELEQYTGKWVAVANHAVVAHSDTLDELLEQLETVESEVDEVFQVPAEAGIACYF